MRHVLTVFDLTTKEIERVFSVTEDLKSKCARGLREPLLPGRVLALLFEKPSLRTRVSFETAILHLGGGSLFLGKDVGWGERESIADFSQVLGQYVDALVCRAKSHRRVEELAEYSPCPIINGLTDLSHPCQALADLYTLREVRGTLRGLKLAYVGDANNVARSLAEASARMGVRFAIASPPRYQFDAAFRATQGRGPRLRPARDDRSRRGRAGCGRRLHGCLGQHGARGRTGRAARAFAGYQINQALLKHAAPQACFLHCLPAHRGLEVTDEVMDGPQSVVIQQAANRMHVQKGLLAWLLGAMT